MDSKKIKRQKIFFVYPPAQTINRDDECLSDIPMTLPVDMMSLSSLAKKRGYETKFCDYAKKNETVYDFLRDLRVFKPDFLVLNVSAEKLKEDLSILTQARELLEDTVVITKGAVFNNNSYGILQQYPEIDIALRNEFELSFDEIIEYKNLKDIKGITYQINNKITSTPDRKTPDNLDYLPFLDRDLIDNNLYQRPDTKKPQSAIRVQKGCPLDCFFCTISSINGKNVRYRNTDLVIKEIKECINKYNIRDFIFLADSITLDNNYVQRLCRQIIRNNLKINFSTNVRIDLINKETALLLKKAGCNLITTGIESGSQKILDKTDKNLNLEGIKEGVKALKEAKIQIYACYLTGLPWETKETIKETYKFAKELNTQFASFYTASALKGTKYYDYITKNRLSEANCDNPYIYPITRSYGLSSDEIYDFNKKMNRNYYLRANYILRMVPEIDSITKLKSYFDAFIKIARNDF